MTINTNLTRILLLMTLSSILSFFGCGGLSGPTLEVIEHADFRIEKRTVKTKRFDYNTGQTRRSSHTKYRIYYKDELVEFPEALNRGTGVSGLWKVYVLEHAPHPALLAGSQSVYLVTAENGEVQIAPVHEQNSSFASLQWLDIEAGQPGLKYDVYRSDDSDLDNVLTKGDFLLVNNSTVVQVSDLSIYPFRRSADLTANFYANQVVGFSPDKEKIVFMGTRDLAPRVYEYALLLYDYRTNATSVLPFDRSACRLHEPYEAAPKGWMDTFFRWEETTDEGIQLMGKTLDQLPPWEGRFSDTGSYQLSPVAAEMKDTFAQFVQQFLELDDSAMKVEQYGDRESYEVVVGEYRFGIAYYDDLRSSGFSTSFLNDDAPESFEIVKRVGEAFNAELRAGKYQELFTAY